MKRPKDQQLLDSYIKEYRLDRYFTDIDSYRSGMQVIQIPKGTYLYERPEHHKYGYFLLEGALKVYANTEDGRQMLVRCCEEPIFIGDMELAGYQESANTVMVAKKSCFLLIDILLLKETLLADVRFLRFLVESLGEKMAYFAARQFQNKVKSSDEKLAEYIQEEADSEYFFKANLRQVSELLGISYRQIHRLLNGFIEDGWLRREAGGYRIIEEVE